jgi:hypothetical protein
MDNDVVVGTVFEFFQYFSLFCAILTLFFVVKRFRCNNQWVWDIPIVLLLAHVIIYYVYIIVMRFTPFDSTMEFLTYWSATLRFHELGTLLIISIVNYIREKNKWGK